MSRFNFKNIKIAGMGVAMPSQKFLTVDQANEELSRETLEKFAKTTGVESAYRTPKEQTASDLCFAAAQELFDKKGVDKESIGALIFVTQTSDYRLPATAFVLHERLKLNKKCVCFDINLGCSGYVSGFAALASLMQNSDIDTGLLMVGDTSSKTDSDTDVSHYLFGDAGSATLLKKEEGSSDINMEIMSDGTGFRNIIMPCGGYRHMEGRKEKTLQDDGYYRSDYDGRMDGTEIFAFSIREVPKAIKGIVEMQGKTVADYDGVVLHQANEMIIKQITKKLKLTEDKVPRSLYQYGNTSCTSIPVTISDKFNCKTEKGDVSLIGCGFGIGLSWGTMTFELNTGDVLPIIHTDECFEDGVL